MIAMAIALEPDLLIADEPTTALDVTIQAQILKLLRELQKDTGMGMLLITHDLGVVAEVGDKVVVMQDGHVVETGSVGVVFSTPQHPYTRRLLNSIPGRYGFPRKPEHQGGEILIEVKNLVKDYGKFRALHGVSLTLTKGQTLGIVGESGSGKSTLARTVLALEDATSGEVMYRGKAVSQLSKAEMFGFRRRVQVVFQDPTASLNPFMNVAQLISEPWTIHRDILPKAQWPIRIRELLEQVGLKAEHALRFPHQFSGGQRQRIAIARALALNPEVIICDEAVSALDVSIQAQIIELLKQLRDTFGFSYLFIAHDLAVVRDFCDSLIVMRDGRIVEAGNTEQVFEHPERTYTKELLASSLMADIPPEFADVARS
jgi:peptide/nickel transport system ATP-binding protein